MIQPINRAGGNMDKKKKNRFFCFIICSAILLINCSEKQLEQALQNKRITKVKFILTIYPSYMTQTDSFGRAPLHKAVLRNQTEMVNLLIQKGADVNTQDLYKYTALHYAAQKNQIDITELLIKNGANINAINSRQRTAIVIALRAEEFRAVKILLKHNPDLTIKDENRKTAYFYAKKSKVKEIIELLKE